MEGAGWVEEAEVRMDWGLAEVLGVKAVVGWAEEVGGKVVAGWVDRGLKEKAVAGWVEKVVMVWVEGGLVLEEVARVEMVDLEVEVG